MQNGNEGYPVELTADPGFARRIVRLAWVSVAALGIIWLLAWRTIPSLPAAHLQLALGWALMPSILALSLRWPRLRYALIIPSTLVAGSLVLICLYALPAAGAPRLGWIFIAAGILLGGVLGIWFWFRWLPVPRTLTEPFSSARWGLIGLHVGLIAGGMLLVGFFADWTP